MSWPNCFLYTLSTAIGTRAHLNATSRRDAHAVPLVPLPETSDNSLELERSLVTPAGLTTLSPRIVFDCFILTSLGLLFAAHKHTQGAVQVTHHVVLAVLSTARTTWLAAGKATG